MPITLHPTASLPTLILSQSGCGGAVKLVWDIHSSPAGACERRYCMTVARATIQSPCSTSHSTLRSRRPSRTIRVWTRVAACAAGLRNSMVNRAGMKSAWP